MRKISASQPFRRLKLTSETAAKKTIGGYDLASVH